MTILMKSSILLVLVFVCFLVTINAQKSNFVKLDDLELHYLEFGKGKETIILIHGLSDTAEVWKGFAPLLADKYKVIAIDRRGVGKSRRTESSYNLKTFAEDIKNLLNKLRLEKVHIVAHSYGGSIATTFAAKFPDRLNTLTLIEGGFWEKREKTPEIPECPHPIEKDCLIANQILSESYEYDPESLFAKITVPTLLVMGIPNFEIQPIEKAEKLKLKTEYGSISRKIKQIARTRLGNGKFVSVKNAEHWVFRDQPYHLATELLSFLRAK